MLGVVGLTSAHDKCLYRSCKYFSWSGRLYVFCLSVLDSIGTLMGFLDEDIFSYVRGIGYYILYYVFFRYIFTSVGFFPTGLTLSYNIIVYITYGRNERSHSKVSSRCTFVFGATRRSGVDFSCVRSSVNG